MEGQKDGWKDGRMDEITEGWMEMQKNGWKDRWRSRGMEQRDGCRGRMINAGAEGWMEGRIMVVGTEGWM